MRIGTAQLRTQSARAVLRQQPVHAEQVQRLVRETPIATATVDDDDVGYIPHRTRRHTLQQAVNTLALVEHWNHDARRLRGCSRKLHVVRRHLPGSATNDRRDVGHAALP